MSTLDWNDITEAHPQGWTTLSADADSGSYTVQEQPSTAGEGTYWRTIAVVGGEVFVADFTGEEARRKAVARAEELDVQAYG